jgi:hypothetical protein
MISLYGVVEKKLEIGGKLLVHPSDTDHYIVGKLYLYVLMSLAISCIVSIVE